MSASEVPLSSTGADAATPEALLHTLLDVSLTGIILFRPVPGTGEEDIVDLAYERLNPAAQQMLGLPEYPAESFLTLYPAARAMGVFDFYCAAFWSGQQERYHINYQHDGLDGYFHFVARRSGPLLVVSFTDTNEQPRSEVEEALRASQARLRAANEEILASNETLARTQQELRQLNEELEARVFERTRDLRHAQAETELQRALLYEVFEQTPVAIAILRGPGLVVELANPAVGAIWGREPAQTLGRPYFEAVPDTAGQGFEQILGKVLATGEPFVVTEAPVMLDRAHTGLPAQAYVNFAFQALHDAYGEIIGLIASGTEVTEQVLSRLRIEASQRQLQLITDALPVLVGYVDQERRYQFANLAYQAWFNQPPAALLGRQVWDVVGEKAYANVRGYLDRALAGERLDFEAEMPYRAEFTRYIRTSYVPDVQNGQVVGCFTLVTDITEAVLAGQQVLALNEELAARNDELAASNRQLSRTNTDLDTFVYTASHDLKVPIANIEGLLDALHRDLRQYPAVTASVQPLLAMMQDAVTRFQQTIGHLTDISRLQQDETPPAGGESLAAVLADVQLDLAPLMHATEAQLTADIAAAPALPLSAKNLRSVVYNLLSNALKYRHPGRVPQVRISCRNWDPATALLEVRDNGLGLTPSQQASLFVLFRRLHDHVEGSGVGLYMVKKMVENAGGSVLVASQAGVGSTFTVLLPLLAGDLT
ncbi:PAS domain-containing protein [Hymenobacter terricola]|uniref:PAS domain-containing protein n=1 Tax=Hymenobacter terricola TaxID=2819236 RepID=UPI001B30D336|nr:PAS domain-containing protein [Hymenobacter terricola]